MLLQKQEEIQRELMISPMDNYLWMQEKVLQEQIQNHLLEQEIYWVQRSYQNWIQFEDKYTKYFQTTATVNKKEKLILKIMDEYGIWPEDQNLTCRFFSNKFNRRLKNDLLATSDTFIQRYQFIG